LRVDQLLSEFGSLIPTPFAKILCRLPIFTSHPPRTSPEGMGHSNDEDPLALAIAPPPDETPEERLVREAAEAEAKRISDEIDEQIARDREQMKKTKRPMKLLLLGALCSAKTHKRGNSGGLFLGQSESGKTATLKSREHKFETSYFLKTFFRLSVDLRTQRVVRRKGCVATRHFPQPYPKRQHCPFSSLQ